MKLDALMEQVITSSRDDWHKITCWGANTGPAYKERLTFYETWDTEFHGVLEAESHANVAVYLPDASITMAFGLDQNDEFKEEWANKFPDPHASSSYVDIFYNNALVFRDVYVTVDGARAKLPLPKRRLDDAKKKIVALEVPRRRHDFIRLVESLEGDVREFDRYFKDAGFVITDDSWPDFSVD
jgi:hypothetical protein